MGDIAMLVPVVHSLAKLHPEVRVTVLSRPFARAFFENLAPNVSFMGAELNTEYKGIRGLNKLYRRLTAKRFTHIADMHDVLRTRYLRMRFVLGRYKVAHIDKHRAEKRNLINADHNDKANFRQLPTSFSNYGDVLKKLGFSVDDSFTSIFSQPRPSLREIAHLTGEKKTFQPWIGIAPFAAHKGKIYPVEKMEQVVQQLIKAQPSARIFLFHGKGEEAEQMKAWLERYPACTSASLTLNGLSQELLLMSNLDCMVSMDSANMHLASLVGCPVVSVWGATHRYAGFMGWKQSPDNAVDLELPCRPCSIYGSRECQFGDYHCLKDIKPEEIVKKVLQTL